MERVRISFYMNLLAHSSIHLVHIHRFLRGLIKPSGAYEQPHQHTVCRCILTYARTPTQMYLYIGAQANTHVDRNIR